MSFKIAGFSDRGEARIVDEHGRLVGFGELVLEEAHMTGLEPGETFALSLRVIWTPQLPDPDELSIECPPTFHGLLS